MRVLKKHLAVLTALCLCNGLAMADDATPEEAAFQEAVKLVVTAAEDDSVDGLVVELLNGDEEREAAEEQVNGDDKPAKKSDTHDDEDHKHEHTTESHSHSEEHVIVIDKDGKKMQLRVTGTNDSPMVFQLDGKEIQQMPGIGDVQFLATTELTSKYMIGVYAEPVSDVLRSHLQLDEGVGLVVQQVFPGSGAAKAGLKPYDVLLKFGDTELKTVAQLSKAVDVAAVEEVEVSFIRGGQPQTGKITAAKRPSSENVTFNMGSAGDVDVQALMEGVMNAAPGVRLGRKSEMRRVVEQAMQQQVNARKIAEKARAQAAEAHSMQRAIVQRAMADRGTEKNDDLREQLDQIRKEMSELRSLIKGIAKSQSGDDQ